MIAQYGGKATHLSNYSAIPLQLTIHKHSGDCRGKLRPRALPKIGDALGTGESSALKMWMAMRACLPLFPHYTYSLVARTEKQIVIQVALALAQRAERPTDCTQVRNRAKFGDLMGGATAGPADPRVTPLPKLANKRADKRSFHHNRLTNGQATIRFALPR